MLVSQAPPSASASASVSPSAPHSEPVEAVDEGDRASITEVGGSIAKFEMAYAPLRNDRFAFGPPLLARLPGYAFFLVAVAFGLTVLAAYSGPSQTRLFVWIVEGDRHRLFGSGPLAFVLMIAAAGNLLKTALRGVIVTADAVEARLLVAGFPKVKRWTWAQIDRVILSGDEVMLELWDGSYERLPTVRAGEALANLLARVATSRGRAVTRLAKPIKG